MTQSYQKECLYCKKEITMSDETGKWLPYNKDGSAHDCRTPADGTAKQEAKKQYTLDEVQKKLESIGIFINLEILMRE